MRALQQRKHNMKCCGCKGKDQVAGILSICGHVGCLACLKKNAANGNCVEAPACEARVSTAHVVPTTHLGVEIDEEGSSNNNPYGSKVGAMLEKVKEIISKGERMIIFCQFDDLLSRIAETLARNNIQAVQVKGRVEDQVKALIPFQTEAKKGAPMVLLLALDHEQSSGLNLTNLNHVLFVHPLLAQSQQQYDAYETQAIGRIRRYGQLKTVYVWRFLVKDSIDTAIYEQRGGRSLTATTVNDM
jgi:SNF2 family DNA or RNA helicase